MSLLSIASPYLVFLGDVQNPLDAKTGRGLVDWRPERCVGQLRYPACRVDLGLPDMSPAEAIAAGARSLVIGVAPTGGQMNPAWIDTFVQALHAGLDLVSGMHTRLGASAQLLQAAEKHGRTLVDVRVPPAGLPVASGRRRSGRRLLTVGTDCCVGKKYTALALHQALAAGGHAATFRATGQTGILIAGSGIPMDAVISDFLSGAAEQLSPDNHAAHWDVIEGQGSLFHPAYAAVTLGLVHGSQPDALVLCHDAARHRIDDYPDYAIPPLAVCIDAYLAAARLTNPAVQCIGISLNTSGVPPPQRDGVLAATAERTGLPCVDPMIQGVEPLLSALPGSPA
jgi:uncharacterized NAD-dependent epimerase/dehydratase family protein